MSTDVTLIGIDSHQVFKTIFFGNPKFTLSKIRAKNVFLALEIIAPFGTHQPTPLRNSVEFRNAALS